MDTIQKTSVNQRQLKEALELVIPFSKPNDAIKEGLDPSTTQDKVLIDLDNSCLVASDHIRLALAKLAVVPEGDFFCKPLQGKFEISSEFAKSLKTFLSKKKKGNPVEISLEKETVCFTVGEETHRTNRLQETFPDYQEQFTSNKGKEKEEIYFEIQKDTLLEKIEAVLSKDDPLVLFKLSDQGVTLSREKTFDPENTATVIPEDMSINNELYFGLKAKYLREGLKKQSGLIRFTANNPELLNSKGWCISFWRLRDHIDYYIAPISIS